MEAVTTPPPGVDIVRQHISEGRTVCKTGGIPIICLNCRRSRCNRRYTPLSRSRVGVATLPSKLVHHRDLVLECPEVRHNVVHKIGHAVRVNAKILAAASFHIHLCAGDGGVLGKSDGCAGIDSAVLGRLTLMEVFRWRTSSGSPSGRMPFP